MPKLKKLFINGNQLNDIFFSLYIESELHLILKNLKYLDLSNNDDIEFKNLEIFYKFISLTEIKELILFHTKFEDYVLNNIKEIIIDNKKNNENVNKQIIKNQKFENFLKFLQERNIKLYVSLINKKQHSTYKKYLFQYSNFILIK
jgi:Leucine-rich repeat (LRR) protein